MRTERAQRARDARAMRAQRAPRARNVRATCVRRARCTRATITAISIAWSVDGTLTAGRDTCGILPPRRDPPTRQRRCRRASGRVGEAPD
eukprot:4334322-Pleurochrysis_carterae.AAC.1